MLTSLSSTVHRQHRECVGVSLRQWTPHRYSGEGYSSLRACDHAIAVIQRKPRQLLSRSPDASRDRRSDSGVLGNPPVAPCSALARGKPSDTGRIADRAASRRRVFLIPIAAIRISDPFGGYSLSKPFLQSVNRLDNSAILSSIFTPCLPQTATTPTAPSVLGFGLLAHGVPAGVPRRRGLPRAPVALPLLARRRARRVPQVRARAASSRSTRPSRGGSRGPAPAAATTFTPPPGRSSPSPLRRCGCGSTRST